VETEKGRQTRTLQAGSGFLSQHSKEVFFGLGEAKGLVRASIRWPSGLVQELRQPPLNHRVWVEEGSEPSRIEAFKAKAVPFSKITTQAEEPLPKIVKSWLLAPVAAPDFSLPDLTGQARTLSALRGKALLLNLWVSGSASCEQDLKVFNALHSRWASQGPQLLAVNLDRLSQGDSDGADKILALALERRLAFPILRGTDDVAGIYNILYRYLFDRHRDLSLPSSFLISDKGDIVKLYQGPIDPEQLERDLRNICLLYTSPSPRDLSTSRMPSSA